MKTNKAVRTLSLAITIAGAICSSVFAETNRIEVIFTGHPAIFVDLTRSEKTPSRVTVTNPAVTDGVEMLGINLIGKESDQNLAVTYLSKKVFFINVKSEGNNIEMPAGEDVTQKILKCQLNTNPVCEIEIDGKIMAVIRQGK